MKRRSFLKQVAAVGAAVPLAAALSGLPAAPEAEAAPIPHEAPSEPLTGRVPHPTRNVDLSTSRLFTRTPAAYSADLIVGYRHSPETGALERYVFKSRFREDVIRDTEGTLRGTGLREPAPAGKVIDGRWHPVSGGSESAPYRASDWNPSQAAEEIIGYRWRSGTRERYVFKSKRNHPDLGRGWVVDEVQR